jgi:hypothetical protein
LKTFHENNDDNLNKNSNNIEDINESISDDDCIYDYEPKDYNYDYSYTEEEPKETSNKVEASNYDSFSINQSIDTDVSYTDQIHNNISDTKITKFKNPITSNLKLISIISIFILIGGTSLIKSEILKNAQDYETSAILQAFPSNTNDFSILNKTIGALPDGRKVYLYELPMIVPHDAITENSVDILTIYNKKVLFTVDNINNESYARDSLRSYDFKTGELETIMNNAKYLNNHLISDNYLILENNDYIYIYDVQNKLGKYLPNIDEDFSINSGYNTILIKDTIFYIYENLLYSYHIPTKKNSNIKLPSCERMHFSGEIDNYFLIEISDQDTFSEKTFIIDSNNTSAIIPLIDDSFNGSIFNTEKSLIFSTTDLNNNIINSAFDKETKELVLIQDDHPTLNTILNNLKFKFNDINSELEIHSMPSDEITKIDLGMYIDSTKSIFQNYDSTFANGILIRIQITESGFYRTYFINVE